MSLVKRAGAALRAFLNPALRQPRPVPPAEPTRVVMDRLLEGRTALVTGAGQGIGRSIALELAGQGASVYVTDVDEGRLAAVGRELAAFPVRSRAFQADVTRPEDTEALLAGLAAEGAAVDLLVNNVGIVADDLGASFATNVIGPAELTRRITGALVARRTPGSVVFLSSIHAHSVFTRTRGYGPTKAAVDALVRQLALELAPHGIRVNAIAPGDVREDERGDVAPWGYTPLEGTSVRPRYIARAVTFLSSEYFSRHTTGAILTIDGGLSLFNYQAAFDAGLFPQDPR